MNDITHTLRGMWKRGSECKRSLLTQMKFLQRQGFFFQYVHLLAISTIMLHNKLAQKSVAYNPKHLFFLLTGLQVTVCLAPGFRWGSLLFHMPPRPPKASSQPECILPIVDAGAPEATPTTEAHLRSLRAPCLLKSTD